MSGRMMASRQRNWLILLILIFVLALVLIQHKTGDEGSQCLGEELTNLICGKILSKHGQVRFDTKPQNTIPKRIHQTFKDYMIPVDYHAAMKTWVRNQPDWEFFFWTDESVTMLIRDRYPQFYQLFKSYDHPLTRSDAIRYFILHQFGGLYVDLDVESIKPIEPFLKTNTCILVPEPTVQTNLIFNLDQSLTNCIMGSVAKHPFMDYLLQSLPKSYRKIVHNHDVLHATGPFFLNKTYTEYQDKFKQCKHGNYCHVYISDYKNLVPRFDVPDVRHNVGFICVRQDIGDLQRRACEKLVSSDFSNPLPDVAYTDHLWLHLGWDNEKKQKVFETKHVFEILPNAVTYEMIRGSSV